MLVEEAHQVLVDHIRIDAGKFYFSGRELSLGTGKIYEGVRYPTYNIGDRLFDTVEGLVFVLTHECDVDPNNRRPFSDQVLICPVIPFEGFVNEHIRQFGADHLRSFLVALATRSVSRVCYLPWGLTELPFGGLMYLNFISHTHVSAFSADGSRPIGAVTWYGLSLVDKTLTNHLLRPKVESLGLEF